MIVDILGILLFFAVTLIGIIIYFGMFVLVAIGFLVVFAKILKWLGVYK